MFEKFTIERTMCYGTCPQYKIEVDNKGKVKWKGFEFVKQKGEREWTISKEKVIQLDDLINQFGYDKYEYNPVGGFVTDFPTVITSVSYSNGYTKKIYHYLGDTLYSNELTEFENKIEEIVGTKEYVGTK